MTQPPDEQPQYFTVFHCLFELVAIGLTGAGCGYLGYKLLGGLGVFLGGCLGLPLWVGFRYAQYRWYARKGER
ncbi:MAG: hypothetical protein ABGY75_06830 [Gemmataceae bacterium]